MREHTQIIIANMSNKIQAKPLLARNTLTSEYALLSNPHSSFSAYEEQLESNLRVLLARHPHLSRQKVRDLLEELDNNCQLALQILDEEQQHCSRIVEEKRIDNKKVQGLSPVEENKILKQSFLNLYKKLLAKTHELEQLQKKYESEKSQNGKLKQMNRLLLQGEYNRSSYNDLTPIY